MDSGGKILDAFFDPLAVSSDALFETLFCFHALSEIRQVPVDYFGFIPEYFSDVEAE